VILTNFPKATTLAARIWLPEDAEQNPVSKIPEYLPYRERDGTYERDALTHPYLAGHGYAGVRVDIRGRVNRRACCSTSTPGRNKCRGDAFLLQGSLRAWEGANELCCRDV
jgi:hypothetical protein